MRQCKPSGEVVKLLSTTGEIIEVDKGLFETTGGNTFRLQIWPNEWGLRERNFVMVIDLSRCRNLKRCQSACNHAHFVSDAQNWD
jgi:molybdopterin-containing oxidoreductase family iron-sulfur binding subunit